MSDKGMVAEAKIMIEMERRGKKGKSDDVQKESFYCSCL
jgi:hypothetical protein